MRPLLRSLAYCGTGFHSRIRDLRTGVMALGHAHMADPPAALAESRQVEYFMGLEPISVDSIISVVFPLMEVFPLAIITNETKRKSYAGEVTLGVGVRMARTVEVGLAMKAAGFDWLFIDLEHGPFDLETAQQISIAALTQGITPLVRVASLDGHLSTRILDSGAQGIVLPHVNNAQEAEEFVKICKFPPEGGRSAGGGLAHGRFEAIGAAEMLSGINDETLLVAMIETPEAGDEADAIAAVAGIDVLLIGTNDLSLGMGIVGRHDDPRVNKVYEQVNAACEKHGKIAGMGGSYDPNMIERRIKEGMRFILAGSDLNFMSAGAKAQASMIRELAG